MNLAFVTFGSLQVGPLTCFLFVSFGFLVSWKFLLTVPRHSIKEARN